MMTTCWEDLEKLQNKGSSAERKEQGGDSPQGKPVEWHEQRKSTDREAVDKAMKSVEKIKVSNSIEVSQEKQYYYDLLGAMELDDQDNEENLE